MEQETTTAPTAEFTGKPGNFLNDMAALAAEQAPPPAPVPEVPVAPQVEVQAQPETTITAMAPATVPDKFKDETGNLDAAKLEKSTADAKAALDKYLTMEKDLRRKMNEVSGLQKQAPPSVTPQVPGPQSTFAAQLEADMAKFGAGAVLERLFEAAKETAKHETKQEVLANFNADREERLEIKSRKELDEIAKFDKDVLTPEGLAALAQIRAERPWLEKSANPTSEAYDVYLAQQIKKARQTGTVLPTPMGPTAKAPPTPVGPTPRAVVKPSAPKLDTPQDIEAHIKSFNGDMAKEGEFWRSRGLKFK